MSNSAKSKANQPKGREMVTPAGDPQVGNLATPVNASDLSVWFINNLPVYRAGLNAQRRGLEIGMAHGYFIYGPFFLLGPFRNTNIAELMGLLGSVGLVAIASACLFVYGNARTAKPLASVTVASPPAELGTSEGWSQLTSGFLVGGLGGVLFAYAIVFALSLFGVVIKGSLG